MADHKDLTDFLKYSNLEGSSDFLIEQGITYQNLVLLHEKKDDDTIRRLFKTIGEEVTFKSKMSEYTRQPTVNSDLDTTTDYSDVLTPASSLISEETPLFIIQSISTPEMPASTSGTLSLLSPCGEADVLPAKRTKSRMNNFNLEHELSQDCMGKAIMSVYKTKGYLDSRLQDNLVTIIALYFLNHFDEYGRLANIDFEDLSLQIVSCFPNEKAEVYYLAPIRKQQTRDKKPGIARGKLIDKYRNKLSFLREAGILEKSGRSKKLSDCEDIPDVPEDLLVKKLWLKHNSQPWIEVEDKWQATFSIRHNEVISCLPISTLLTDWPSVHNNLGYTLIEKDFSTLHPEKTVRTYEKFDTFFKGILNYRKSSISTETELIYLDCLNTNKNLSENSICYMQLVILSSMLTPRTRVKTGKGVWKPSSSECREGIFVDVKIAADIKDAVEKKRTKMHKHGLTLQPFLIVQGTSAFNIEAVYVVLEDTTYTFDSMKKAFDLCFKIFQVFNLTYPPESRQVYTLIQWMVYDLFTDYDDKTPFIIDLLQKIKHGK